jgi:hypothetical protein
LNSNTVSSSFNGYKWFGFIPAEHVAAVLVLGPLSVVEVVVAGLADTHAQQRVSENAGVRIDFGCNLKIYKIIVLVKKSQVFYICWWA